MHFWRLKSLRIWGLGLLLLISFSFFFFFYSWKSFVSSKERTVVEAQKEVKSEEMLQAFERTKKQWGSSFQEIFDLIGLSWAQFRDQYYLKYDPLLAPPVLDSVALIQDIKPLLAQLSDEDLLTLQKKVKAGLDLFMKMQVRIDFKSPVPPFSTVEKVQVLIVLWGAIVEEQWTRVVQKGF